MSELEYKTRLANALRRGIDPASQGTFVLNQLLSTPYGPLIVGPLYSKNYSDSEFTDYVVERLIFPISDIYLQSIRGENTKLLTLKSANEICRSHHHILGVTLIEGSVISWLDNASESLAHYAKNNHYWARELDQSYLALMYKTTRSFDLSGFWSEVDKDDRERISVLMWRKIRKNEGFDYKLLGYRLGITEAEAKKKNTITPIEISRMLQISILGVHRLMSGEPTPLERNALIVNSYCMREESVKIVKNLGQGQAEIMLLAAGVGAVRTDLAGLNLQELASEMDALHTAYESENSDD